MFVFSGASVGAVCRDLEALWHFNKILLFGDLYLYGIITDPSTFNDHDILSFWISDSTGFLKLTEVYKLVQVYE